jgi:hypothetical protein
MAANVLSTHTVTVPSAPLALHDKPGAAIVDASIAAAKLELSITLLQAVDRKARCQK